MVKDRGNVDDVIHIEVLLDVMGCTYVDVVFTKLVKILDLKGLNKLLIQIIYGCEKNW